MHLQYKLWSRLFWRCNGGGRMAPFLCRNGVELQGPLVFRLPLPRSRM